MRLNRIVWLFAALAVLVLPLTAAAQTQTGRITGVVVDDMGAVVPGATVTIKGPGGITRQAVSDAAGKYDVPDLPAGSYQVTVELSGFTTQTTTVAVAAGQPVSVQTKLAIAARAENVQVTGTLIPRPTFEAMTPVTTMNIEELSYQGKTRLEDLLTTLPQIFVAQNSSVSNGASGTATVNLRNLGVNRTLVLIDGMRMPTGDTGSVVPDLNFIPAALVKRVDVLTGGASSVYGADAVAGVVNFVLDTDFQGIRAGFSPGGFQHNNNDALARQINTARGFTFPTGSTWDGGQYDAYAAIGGKFGSNGHATAYLDYRKTNALLKSARDYTNCSVSNLGDNGPACGGSSTAPTGRFWTDDGNSYTLGSNNTFIPWSQGPGPFNYAPYNYMQRPDQRWAGGGFLNYKWNPWVEAYTSTMFMNDQTDAQIAPSGDFGNTLQINCNNPMLSPDMVQKICTANGYGPNDIAGLQVYRRNVEGGGRLDKLSHTSVRLVGGVRGQLSKNKAWHYDMYTLYADTKRPETYLNDLNTTRLQEALFVTGTPGQPSTWRCTSGNANCVPWNIFQNGGVTRAALNYLQLPLVSNGDAKTQLVGGRVTADLKNYGIKFPTATEGISFAVGSEYRKESLDLQTDLAYQDFLGAGQGGPLLPVSGFYDVKDLFAEGVVPLVQDVRGAKDLSVSVGYRYSDYNLTGRHPSWKIEGDWAPSEDFKARGGFNRAVRSPNVVELFSQRGITLGGSTDPCSGANPSLTLAQCQHTGITAAQYGNIAPNTAGQYNTIAGGNPDLVPETADTTTVGVVVSPRKISGFSTAIDFYDINLKETIGTLQADQVIQMCATTGNPALCGLVHRDQFGSLWRTPNGYTVATNLNIGSMRVRGIDVNSNYVVPWRRSSFSFNLIGSYLMKSYQDTGLFQYDCTALTGPVCNDPYGPHPGMQPRWRHLFRGSWERNALTLSAGWRFIGPVSDERLSDQTDLQDLSMRQQLVANLADHYNAWNYIDTAVSYKLMKGVNATLGVNNVFDKNPPLGSGSNANDYGAGFYNTYDSYGRFVHFSLQFTF